ncbi:hypothetical protein AYK61_09975 [Rhodococcus sp. SBT000017]|nr:hypothetical protein AYK61_09975 [Rhodococcus sp. SBT000017]
MRGGPDTDDYPRSSRPDRTDNHADAEGRVRTLRADRHNHTLTDGSHRSADRVDCADDDFPHRDGSRPADDGTDPHHHCSPDDHGSPDDHDSPDDHGSPDHHNSADDHRDRRADRRVIDNRGAHVGSGRNHLDQRRPIS